jgi:hypothetical protein
MLALLCLDCHEDARNGDKDDPIQQAPVDADLPKPNFTLFT